MAKKDKVRLSDQELNAQTKRLVEIRPIANEYGLLCRSIKEELLARGRDEHRTPEGHTAKIARTKRYSWVVEKLKKALPGALFASLCPPKPDAKKLNQRIAACPEDKALAACRVEDGEERELEVIAAEASVPAAG
ncbi:MAG: hypothetical protein HS116_02290 [Planctomycetes bacterium]|nr:hypothetical protein [Planctomycetota bacterium]